MESRAKTSGAAGNASIANAARHNPSLNHRTHYGRPSWPGLRYAVHFPSPGQAVPPQRSG
jgi:hypothetical protein